MSMTDATGVDTTACLGFRPSLGHAGGKENVRVCDSVHAPWKLLLACLLACLLSSKILSLEPMHASMIVLLLERPF